MTKRIPLTEAYYDFLNSRGWEISGELLIMRKDGGVLDIEELKKQILDEHKKAGLFDSLLVENQKTLDTISQVKIVNSILDQQLSDARNQVITHAAMCMSNKNKLAKIKNYLNTENFHSDDSDNLQTLFKILEENS